MLCACDKLVSSLSLEMLFFYSHLLLPFQATWLSCDLDSLVQVKL
jgi:hypothetical protein